jgi:hypothetical protein
MSTAEVKPTARKERLLNLQDYTVSALTDLPSILVISEHSRRLGVSTAPTLEIRAKANDITSPAPNRNC